MTLHLDFETRSAVDLGDVGIHNYACHPTTEILMLAYAFGKGEVQLWQPHSEPLPDRLHKALLDNNVKKGAWNAEFELNIFLRKLDISIPYDLWEDPSRNCRYLSMPGGLDDACKILDMDYGLRKNSDGDRLKDLFSMPLPIKKKRKVATNENTLFDISPTETIVAPPVFADHISHPEDWELFCGYCKQDVVAERAIGDLVGFFPLPEREVRILHLDRKINDAGMPTDRKFVECALELAIRDKNLQKENLGKLTGIEKPTDKKFLPWIQKQGYPYNSLRKEPVTVALNDPDVKLTALGREALEVRKKSSKTSYTKLAAILPALSSDDRLRDQFLFMGSARAGRWSGRAVQLHNMARPIKAVEKIKDLEDARRLIFANDFDGIVKRFTDKKTNKPGSVIDVTTSTIRSCFVAPPEKLLVVCDLNAIENRVLGWVAGEEKILEVFRKNRCPYLDFGSKMYRIPFEVLKADYDRGDVDAKEKRQVAKPAVLGAGYRLSGGEWKTKPNGDRYKSGLWGYAENMGVLISKELAHESVKAFRAEYKKVVQLWYDSENAVARCLKQGGQQMIGPTGLVWCDRKRRKDGSFILRIHLPSGRCLHYLNASLEITKHEGERGPYTKENFTYDGIDQVTRIWGMVRSHGGKIVENIVQAISRDVLADAMVVADDLGFEIVGHCHDEIITLTDDNQNLGLVDLRWVMCQTPDWAPGLILNAEGYEGYVYRKG